MNPGIVHLHQQAFCAADMKTLRGKGEMLSISHLIHERRGQSRRAC